MKVGPADKGGRGADWSPGLSGREPEGEHPAAEQL